MSKANAAEQYMLELINAARALTGVQPLAFDGELNESSEDHSSWMLSTDVFSHTGVGGSNPGDRMETAGYDFSGNWTWGENIAWKSFNGTVNIQAEVQQLHTNLMNSPGHRANLLKGDFREIGVGIETGRIENFNAAMVTQNFARTASNSFLTGVAFSDLDSDDHYDIGEGFDDVTVSATNNSTGVITTTTTNVGGGYDLELVNGTYTVSFSGGDFSTIDTQASINNTNVKLDLINPDTTGGTPAPAPDPDPDPAPEPAPAPEPEPEPDPAPEPEPAPAPAPDSHPASAAEQYMLELINADRAKVGAQPLAFNDALNKSSEDHSNWILETDTFSHRGVDGSSPGDRMATAGYDFSGASASAENLAGLSTRTPDELQDEVQQMHNMLMNSPGHRANLLNNNFREVGVGVETGKFRVYDVALVTQNFARTASDFFLTGVVSNDEDSDHHYDINEGLAGVTVSAKNNATDAIVTTTTNEGGGYDLKLVNGTYTVSFSDDDFITTDLQASINNKNVKLDLVDPDTTSNNTPEPAPETIPEPIPEPQLNTITGTSRSDFLRGTAGDDEILGLDGRDRLHGSDGNDHIDGGNGSDILFGGADADILTGGTGRDYFVFNTPFDNTVDMVVDFSPRDDYIVLDDAIFTSLHRGRLDASAFHIGAEAHDATDHIIYNSETGALYFDVDAAGGADAIQFAELTSGLTLNNTDFYII